MEALLVWRPRKSLASLVVKLAQSNWKFVAASA
jgi:hypothetical protein